MKNKDHVSINEKFPRRIDIHKILGIDHTYCTYYNTYFIFYIQHYTQIIIIAWKIIPRTKLRKAPKEKHFLNTYKLNLIKINSWNESPSKEY